MAAAKERFLATTPQLTESDREVLELSYAMYQSDILHRWTDEQKK